MKKIFFTLILVFIFTSCNQNSNIETTNHILTPEKTEINTTTVTNTPKTTSEQKTEPPKTEIPKIETLPIDKIQEKIDAMTIEEKIGQLFFVAFRKDALNVPYTEANKFVTDSIEKYNFGGIVLFSENIVTKEQTKNFIDKMQSVSKIPLFIGIDEEGGLVSRLKSIYKTPTPKASIIGSSKDISLAYNTAVEISKRIGELGFNMNFAPVADVNSNPKNTVIGERAFGSDKNIVSEMVEAQVKAYSDNNIYSVIKHFPGHGDTTSDTHVGSASTNKTLDELIENEFVPFAKGIESGCDGIMVAHISTPNIPENTEPAIFSKSLITDILRTKFNFNGIVITDAMDMAAITKYYSSGEACIKAFNAGVDVFLMPENLKTAYEDFLTAFKNSEISEKRIDESVYRILKLKEKYISIS